MRNLGLDILRAAAILLVLCRHVLSPQNILFLEVLQRGGWVGVDVFFVLSGFWIAHGLFAEYEHHERIQVARFLGRRALRIIPPFLVMILFTLFLASGRQQLIAAQAMLGELIFLQNYIGGLWNHTWSIAVEVHFYILMAWLSWLSTRWLLRPFPEFVLIVAIATILICPCLRVWTSISIPSYSHQTHLFGTHLRLDTLMFGVLLAYGCCYQQIEERLMSVPTWLFLLVGAMLTSPAFLFEVETHRWISMWGVTVFYLGIGSLVIGSLRLKNLPKNLWKRWICLGVGRVGMASYSVYLYHMLVNMGFWEIIRLWWGDASYSAYLGLYFGGSLLLGISLFDLTEKPLELFRNRFFPKTGLLEGG